MVVVPSLQAALYIPSVILNSNKVKLLYHISQATLCAIVQLRYPYVTGKRPDCLSSDPGGHHRKSGHWRYFEGD